MLLCGEDAHTMSIRMLWVKCTTSAEYKSIRIAESLVMDGWVIRLKRIYNFLMLHACFYTICLVFRYTSWHFYAFSGTNQLTRCHSASSLFSAVFVLQKSYTGNILRIGRNKSRTSRNLPKLPENQRGDREGPQGGHTTRGRGLPLAHAHLW
jgi:hypothetical protein